MEARDTTVIRVLDCLTWRTNPKVRQLSEVPLFEGLPRSELAFLAANLDEANAEAGETLIREGRHNHAFWILLDGEVELFVENTPRHTLHRSEFFGETSMLDRCQAVATARTRTPIRALVAGSAQFRAFKGNDTVAARLRSAALEPARADGEPPESV
jgi:CRP-like cAMP-binding protein